MRLIVVIPAYNEEERVKEIVSRVLNKTKANIVVVDDGSQDSSWQVIKKLAQKNNRIIPFKHQINLGKGAAMKTGAQAAWKLGADAIIFMDSDGQHNPKHLNNFEKALVKFPIVFGYRELGSNVPSVRKWGNIFASKLMKILFNIKRRDLLCGFMAIRKGVYPKIKWESARYGVETEIATKVGKQKLDFSEIKIDTIYIDKYKGVSILDALKILFNIPFWYFSK